MPGSVTRTPAYVTTPTPLVSPSGMVETPRLAGRGIYTYALPPLRTLRVPQPSPSNALIGGGAGTKIVCRSRASGNPYGDSTCSYRKLDSPPIKALGGRLRHGNDKGGRFHGTLDFRFHGNDSLLCRSRENGNPYGGSTCSMRKLDSRSPIRTLGDKLLGNDNLTDCSGMTEGVGPLCRVIHSNCVKVVPLFSIPL